MPSTNNCRIQVNFKSGVADLINVYADSFDEAQTSLADLRALAYAISETEVALQNPNPQAPPGEQQALTTVKAAFPESSQPLPVPATPTPAPDAPPACQHGPMTWKTGTSKAGKDYKGYFCTTPRSTCSPVWG